MSATTATLTQRIRDREPLLGTFVSLGSATVTNLLASVGYDFLLIDLEHGAGSEAILQGQLFAAEAEGVAAMVRTETFDRIRIGRVLDLGARAVMLPRVDTPAQCAGAVAHLRYPPVGDRGVASSNRARGWSTRTGSFTDANREIAAVVQIESAEAVESVEEIAAVDGVDALFVGPSDLSHSLGVPGELESPAFTDALERVLQAARAHDLAAGILAPTPERARALHEQGFTLIVLSADVNMLAAAARDAVTRTRDALGRTRAG
ncbi:MAG TPA: aldolase/citrate lyase family protein [Solirubrobacteraceae bacterium]|nr:aldolase/citrate lyase family protein [Solirubrobacteraceae bacterium]